VPDLSLLNNGTIYLDQVELTTRRLADEQRVPIIQVNVIPGLESNPADLQFTWNVT